MIQQAHYELLERAKLLLKLASETLTPSLWSVAHLTPQERREKLQTAIAHTSLADECLQELLKDGTL